MNFLESDLFYFAYVPGWDSQLDALAGLARPEPWRFREPMYLTMLLKMCNRLSSL